MLQFMCSGMGQVDEGRPLYVLKKADDDLRQDQLMLGMLAVFNSIWAENKVSYPTVDGAAVQACIYDVRIVDALRGFVRCLPEASSVKDVRLQTMRDAEPREIFHTRLSN